MKYLGFGIIAIAAFIVVAFFFMGQQSKEGAALGLVDGKPAPCPASPNCVSSESDDPEKNVPPLALIHWEQLPNLVSEMGGEVTQSNDDYIASEFTSSIFQFVDDVEFKRTEDAIQIRSASRVGHSDGGVNRARVETIHSAFQSN